MFFLLSLQHCNEVAHYQFAVDMVLAFEERMRLHVKKAQFAVNFAWIVLVSLHCVKQAVDQAHCLNFEFL